MILDWGGAGGWHREPDLPRTLKLLVLWAFPSFFHSFVTSFSTTFWGFFSLCVIAKCYQWGLKGMGNLWDHPGCKDRSFGMSGWNHPVVSSVGMISGGFQLDFPYLRQIVGVVFFYWHSHTNPRHKNSLARGEAKHDPSSPDKSNYGAFYKPSVPFPLPGHIAKRVLLMCWASLVFIRTRFCFLQLLKSPEHLPPH